MRLVDTITPILEAKGPGLVRLLTESPGYRKHRDTGATADNTTFTITQAGKTYTLTVVGPAQWRRLRYGRGPNRSGRPSKKMVDALRGWVVRHGMDESAAWPVAAKIAREGYDYSQDFAGLFAGQDISQDLTRALGPAIRQDIVNLLNQ